MADAESASMRTSPLKPFRRLRTIDNDTLRAVLEAQRQRFGKGGAKEPDPPGDDDAPPQEEPGGGFAAAAPAPPPQARFDPGGDFHRPSDFVKHLARKFEEGELNPKTGHIAIAIVMIIFNIIITIIIITTTIIIIMPQIPMKIWFSAGLTPRPSS